MSTPNTELVISAVSYDDPDAAKLIGEVQQVYVVRYGGVDASPLDPAEFGPPTGLFLVGHVDGVPVACGGWRVHDADEPGFVAGDVELKRMYVVPAMQGRGLARRMLAALESAALRAGHRRLVLSTGDRQPEAIALYESSGYAAIAPFGYFRDSPACRCFAKQLVS